MPMQQQLVAGDSLVFSESFPAYPASAGWVLQFRMVPRDATHGVLTFGASAAGDGHQVNVPSAVTGAWAADDYSWAAWVARDGQEHTVRTGQLRVRQNPRTALAGYDGRTEAQRALADLREALADWNANGGRVKRYKIGTREMEFNSTAEILQRIRYWETVVAREETAALGQHGRPTGGRFYIRSK